MNAKGLSLFVLIVGLCMTASVAQGQDWSLNRLNPFADKSSKRASQKPAAKFSLPGMPKLPKLGTWPKPPNLLAPVKKFNKGTKKFFVKTADYLSPSKLIPGGDARRASHRTSRHSPAWKMPGAPEKKKSLMPSFMPSLFRREFPPPPRTPQEFMRLERIKP